MTAIGQRGSGKSCVLNALAAPEAAPFGQPDRGSFGGALDVGRELLRLRGSRMGISLPVSRSFSTVRRSSGVRSKYTPYHLVAYDHLVLLRWTRTAPPTGALSAGAFRYNTLLSDLLMY